MTNWQRWCMPLMHSRTLMIHERYSVAGLAIELANVNVPSTLHLIDGAFGAWLYDPLELDIFIGTEDLGFSNAQRFEWMTFWIGVKTRQQQTSRLNAHLVKSSTLKAWWKHDGEIWYSQQVSYLGWKRWRRRKSEMNEVMANSAIRT